MRDQGRLVATAGRARRRYRGRVQAEIAALSRVRILDAALALFAERWLDELTLEQIASRAAVTVQTLIRHFGTKERLFAAAGAEAHRRAVEQRAKTPVGDLGAAAGTLIAHYEEVGDRLCRLLAQEERHPALHALLDAGRARHRAWVETTFAPFLMAEDGAARARRLSVLAAVTDVHVWRLLRRDLARNDTELALREMVAALVARGPRPTPPPMVAKRRTRSPREGG